MTSPSLSQLATPFTAQPAIPLPLEAAFAGDIARGTKGRRARLVQEWLTLQGVKVQIDDDFGGVTETAVRAFQTARGLPPNGIVDRATFDALVAPMVAAMQTITPPPNATFGQMTVLYARQHLAQHPQEVGGPNMGPWVRLYMDGEQGAPQAWCAGFATYMQRLASATLHQPVPVKRSVGCDDLARAAQRDPSGTRFSHGCPDIARITPGSLFLLRKTDTDWHHTGIVTGAEAEGFHTIEGNTNDQGSRDGFEVCARVRHYDLMDFIVVA